MTSYLQRLFDRAAGLAARPATALTPSFSSRSPIAEADQRLNLPDLGASLFALSPGFDAPSPGDDETLSGIEEPAARPMPRRAAPPIAASTEAPPLSPREVAERRQPPVTRREMVAAAAPEAAAQPPARMMPATAESVSRIGKLTPRRRAQLVFGLRRR